MPGEPTGQAERAGGDERGPGVDTCARDPARCAARVDALQGQLKLARDLRDQGRGAQALQLLTALTDTARTTLGPDHPLGREAERERAALTATLARKAPAAP